MKQKEHMGRNTIIEGGIRQLKEAFEVKELVGVSFILTGIP